jgi:hypothetical protein
MKASGNRFQERAHDGASHRKGRPDLSRSPWPSHIEIELARLLRAFLPEFGSFVRGEAIVKMSELRRKGVPRSDLKISRQILIWLRSQRTSKR